MDPSRLCVLPWKQEPLTICFRASGRISASSANENFVMVEFEEGFVTSDDDTAIAVGLRKNSDLTEKSMRF